MTSGRTVHLIANPNSGRGSQRRAEKIDLFRETLLSHGVGSSLSLTVSVGDAARLAREATQRGEREIVVAGGDGTINEALQGLIGTGARLGVLPSGTANVLARALSLPSDPERAARVVALGASRKIYAGLATEEATGARRYFLLMAGAGLDASVVARVSPRLKRRVGEAAFWFSGLSHLVSWEPAPFSVEIGGETHAATFAAIGRAPRYGGELSITPRARLDAPEFEVCVVDTRSRLRYLRLLAHSLRAGGAPEGRGGVRYFRATRVRAVGGGALVQADGELIGALPMTFEIVADPVEVIAPPEDEAGRIGY